MAPRALNLLQALLLAALAGLIGWQVLQQQRGALRVLVVHSYNTDLPWVGDIDQGLARAAAVAPRPVQVRQHYMNLLNRPDCHHYRLAAEDARLAVEDWQPDVVVLVDDLAQALVGFALLALEPGAPLAALREGIVAQLTERRCPGQGAAHFGLDRRAVLPGRHGQPLPLVFAGVNGDVERYGYGHARHVTGIFEHKNVTVLAETLDTVAASAARPPRGVQVLNDASPTALSENPRWAAPHGGRLPWQPPRNAATWAEWQDAVLQANADDAMLLIANYQDLRDERGQLVPPGRVVAWTERHALHPPVGANTNFVTDGGAITLAVSGTEQGEVAMALALQAAAGGPMPPPRSAQQLLVGLNPALVRQRGLKLPAVYEAFAREIGRFVDVSEHVYGETAPRGALAPGAAPASPAHAPAPASPAQR